MTISSERQFFCLDIPNWHSNVLHLVSTLCKNVRKFAPSGNGSGRLFSSLSLKHAAWFWLIIFKISDITLFVFIEVYRLFASKVIISCLRMSIFLQSGKNLSLKVFGPSTKYLHFAAIGAIKFYIFMGI